MRYAQRGGYTPVEQEKRELLRLEAAERFERGDDAAVIAKDLRVTERTVRRWRKVWREGGTAALKSKGPVSRERLSVRDRDRLEAELKRGPLAHGFRDDQRGPLGRIKTLIGRLFHKGYTIQGVAKLLKRHGWSCQVPVRHAIERDEDEAGQGLRPPKGRTWAPRGARPVVRVRGRGNGRVNIAGAVCYRPGNRPHFFYRLHVYHGRKGEPKTFAWHEYRDLIITAHQQLDAPLVWCWDNLNVHLAKELAAFAEEHADWLRIFQMPSYARELNPAEGVWSLLKRAIVNFVAPDLSGLVRIVKRKLKKIQFRPHLIDGCLAGTGLIIEPW